MLFIVELYSRRGWPDSVDSHPELRPYFARKLELSVEQHCVLWGSLVIIPETCQEAVLHQLREGHPGMARMKNLARMYLWWPGMTKDIETLVHQCHMCQSVQSVPHASPLQPWSGLHDCGPGYIWTMLVQSMGRWFWYWWMPILNG